tara:strand:+ start:119 stop:535 length:417 start_codon:yes stop_codon:yes gene_type:complete
VLVTNTPIIVGVLLPPLGNNMKRINIKKLDKLWSEAIRINEMCEVCNRTSRLNAHHFYSRSIMRVRWDIDNGFCLCVGCHVFSSKFSAHKTPAEFVEWAIESRGQGWYDSLKEKKNSLLKYIDDDYDEIVLDITKHII